MDYTLLDPLLSSEMLANSLSFILGELIKSNQPTLRSFISNALVTVLRCSLSLALVGIDHTCGIVLGCEVAKKVRDFTRSERMVSQLGIAHQPHRILIQVMIIAVGGCCLSAKRKTICRRCSASNSCQPETLPPFQELEPGLMSCNLFTSTLQTASIPW